MTFTQFHAIQRRRDFLKNVASGIGMAALGDLLAADGLTAATLPEVNPLAPKHPHFQAKAKHVIFMFMEGGPSQYELFDPKPGLQEHHGSALP